MTTKAYRPLTDKQIKALTYGQLSNRIEYCTRISDGDTAPFDLKDAAYSLRRFPKLAAQILAVVPKAEAAFKTVDAEWDKLMDEQQRRDDLEYENESYESYSAPRGKARRRRGKGKGRCSVGASHR